jgi:mutator protein MutT
MEKSKDKPLKRQQQIIGAAIVVRAGTILLVQRARDEVNMANLWEFPSGKKKIGERLAEAAMRECKEETGLDVAIDQLVDYFEYGTQKKGIAKDCIQLTFLAFPTTPDQEVKLSREHQAFRWVSQDEIDQVANGHVVVVLRKAFALLHHKK